jgi:hypothetical protein
MSDEATQPAEVEGQGAETQEGNDLYSAFLDGISPEMHDTVIPALKAQDASFTKRFQSLSEKTKPFEELGVFDMDPEQVGGYLGLANALEAAAEGDEQAQESVHEWWDQVGEQLGFYEAGQGEEDSGDMSDEDFDPFDKNQLTSLLQNQVQEMVGPIAEYVQQQQTSQQEKEALAAAEAQIDESISALKTENPDLPDEVIGEVLELAEMFIDSSDDPIAAGFEKYKSLVSKGESQLFDKKRQQPGLPEGSGPAATTPEPITSNNVAQIARERLEKEKQLLG